MAAAEEQKTAEAAKTAGSASAKGSAKASGKKGGARPGSGRKLAGAAPLDAKVHIRLEESQRSLFTSLGGVKWLRRVLDRIEAMINKAGAAPADLESPAVIGVLPQTIEPLLVERAKERGDLSQEDEAQTLRASGLRQYDAAEVIYGRKTAAGERRSERRIYVLRAAGDAMIDAGIGAGDLVVVDAARVPKSGDIACARINGELSIRRIFFTGDDPSSAADLRLEAENAAAPHETIRPTAWLRVNVEGTVVSAVKPLARNVKV